MELDPNKIAANPFAAGLVGALVGLRFAPGISWLERIGNAAAGGAFAGFIAPAAAEWFQLTSTGMASGLAFAIGMFGMSLAAAVMQALREVELGKIITGWISRR